VILAEDVLGGRNQDIFAKPISYDFSLAEAMWKPYYLRN
jgi:hypothetical protein